MPILARRVIETIGANDSLFVDLEPFRVKGVGSLVKDECSNWLRLIEAAGRTRKDLGAILLVLDGDMDRLPQSWQYYVDRFRRLDFCEYHVAAALAAEARKVRAGDAFSLGIVFAMKEFEAWLVAGVESLRGKMLTGSRGRVSLAATRPSINVDATRDAKGELRKQIPEYDQLLDQATLAAEVNLTAVSTHSRSFRRFENAISQLAHAVRTNGPIVTPSP